MIFVLGVLLGVFVALWWRERRWRLETTRRMAAYAELSRLAQERFTRAQAQERFWKVKA